mgnify:CR=1 FL=1
MTSDVVHFDYDKDSLLSWGEVHAIHLYERYKSEADEVVQLTHLFHNKLQAVEATEFGSLGWVHAHAAVPLVARSINIKLRSADIRLHTLAAAYHQANETTQAES